MINLSLNSEPVEKGNGLSLAQLLEEHPPEGAFAVALNGEFVPRARYGDTTLKDGDEIDIVGPVGGG